MMSGKQRYKSRSELRSVVFDFAHGMCEWPQCGERATELAHIVSTGMGGDPKHNRDTVGNVFAACSAHARISDGLPPPGGGELERNREYIKVPGAYLAAKDEVSGRWRTGDVMRQLAKWLGVVRKERAALEVGLRNDE